MKDKKLTFSVLICVYKNDKSEYFASALDSVMNQSLKAEEIILIVDGPVPDSINHIIERYTCVQALQVLRLAVNMGHGNARRYGLEHCSCQYVALMDSDDISRHDRFEKQIKCFEENSNLHVVGGNIAEFSKSPEHITGIRRVPEKDDEIKKYMRSRCPFNQVTVMFKKSIAMEAGGYLDWYCNEDYYLWIRMFQHGAVFCNLNQILVDVRTGSDMYKRRGGFKYFISEAGIQNYMKKNKIISLPQYLYNIAVRFIVQILMPNRVRGFVFRKFAREESKANEEKI